MKDAFVVDLLCLPVGQFLGLGASWCMNALSSMFSLYQMVTWSVIFVALVAKSVGERLVIMLFPFFAIFWGSEGVGELFVQ